MSNKYFNHNDRLVPFSSARAEDVNDLFDAVATGFDQTGVDVAAYSAAAEAERIAAEAAQLAAEVAQTGAQAARTGAETAQGGAETARDVVLNDLGFQAVSADLTGPDTIGVVATNIASVNLTAGSIANVNTVAPSIANINTVAPSIANVNTAATNIGSINTAAANIDGINAAPGAAAAALASELKAADWAEKATEVDPGQFSAKYWAGVAGSAVSDGVINDAQTSLSMTWSSQKISDIPRAEIIRVSRTSNTQLNAGNFASLIDITSGTFAQTFDACSSLGDGWFCYIRNAGTGDITLAPDGAETIDGLTSFVMYPGEVRMIQCDGTALRSIVLNAFFRTFDASGTFTKPPGYASFQGFAWGGGGSGGKGGASGSASGGGGGACVPFTLTASSVGATETVTIGAGGAAITSNPGGVGAANPGGNTLFGTLATSYGGGGGAFSNGLANLSGGGGGGALEAGQNGSTGIATGGKPAVAANLDNPGFGGASISNTGSGISSVYGGAAGGSGANSGVGRNGGNSLYGGAGGSGVGSSGTTVAGGSSVHGGSGGASNKTASASDGATPGGGGGATGSGATSGAGARGELRIWGII